jgi:uncharacterized protein YndB with AHSA1/START domain
MLKKIAIVVIVLILGILAFAATKPDTFRVERTVTIKAPPEKIYPLLDDFHNWPTWSPWEKKDPAMKRTHSGPEKGKGALYAWEGNREVGKGRMEILESSPSRVFIKLDFLEPFEGHNTAEFTLEPKGDTTTVRWVMDGPAPFISKVIQVFCSMDRMIGKDFEEGLANMKAAAEK